ncbi:hypothetical protein [Clostridium tarantellae]|uniref:DnaJ domain-containing protein n=1 Tax=Clostridium tarantellae TaxID=39493 RepID=A0A6I1MRU7_9CLOT|nr:hypothetical protein [Clostridium tarantellae]MPQ45188.1 hypothetical protein [Clostridium tarantellae]
MDWLNVESIEDLKAFGNLQKTRVLIRKDLETLFKNKKSKDKNIVEMIKLNSGSWQGLFDKIIALRSVIEDLQNNLVNNNIVKEGYFNNLACEYIFYILELDGKQRADKLKITMKCYSNKKIAKKWRDSIAKVIHPDKCPNKGATEAIVKLNQLYEEMVGNE